MNKTKIKKCPYKHPRKFYKGRYIIALYDLETDEICYGVFNNIYEISEFTGTEFYSLYSSMTRLFNHQKNMNGSTLRAIRTPFGKAVPYLIELTKEEIKNDKFS